MAATVVCDRGMTIVLGEPKIEALDGIVGVLREWQADAAPMQLHPGDLGWFWRFGAEATAAAVRTWTRRGHVAAVGLLDGPKLLRLTTAPEARRDVELARRITDDVTRPERGVLPAGEVSIEAPTGAVVHDLLRSAGWADDESWTPLRRDLGRPVESPEVRVDVVGPELAGVWNDVQRASFGVPALPDSRWHTMAAGPAFADGRCLVAYDDQGNAAAAVAVWSAGPGRPGLLEPMGVHPEHRRRGFGTAISLAAAATLQELGSSSAVVCTPSSNPGAVVTYESAGFEQLPERRDRHRAA